MMASVLVKSMRDDGNMGLAFTMDDFSCVIATPGDDEISNAPMHFSDTKRDLSAPMQFASPKVNRTAGMADALFKDIRPVDVKQGSLGDCWLASAIASVARFPKAVKSMFEQECVSKDHWYHVMLYSKVQQTWVNVSIDDRIPVDGDSAKYMKVSDMGESWPLLLDKSVAKLYDGYEKLENKWSSLAFNILTGDELSIQYVLLGRGGWSTATINAESQTFEIAQVPSKSNDEIWDVLKVAHRGHRLMAAGMLSGATRECPSACHQCQLNQVQGGVHQFICDKQPENLPTYSCERTQTSDLPLTGWWCEEKVVAIPKNCAKFDQCENSKGVLADCLVCSKADGNDWMPKAHECKDAIASGSRFPSANDVVLPFRTLQIPRLDDATNFVLKAWDPVVVVDVDSDGDVRVRNPDGVESKWMYRKNFVYKAEIQSNASRVCVALTGSNGEAQRSDGLFAGHEYSLLRVQEFVPGAAAKVCMIKDRVVFQHFCKRPDSRNATWQEVDINSINHTLRLVRVRNPWGNEVMWNGAWSDKDRMWKEHPDVARAVGLEPAEDGAWWMSFEDFSRAFTDITLGGVDMLTFVPGQVSNNTQPSKSWAASTSFSFVGILLLRYLVL